jgi:hypothetical protein
MGCSSELGNYFDDEAAGIRRRPTTKTSTPDRREELRPGNPMAPGRKGWALNASLIADLTGLRNAGHKTAHMLHAHRRRGHLTPRGGRRGRGCYAPAYWLGCSPGDRWRRWATDAARSSAMRRPTSLAVRCGLRRRSIDQPTRSAACLDRA